MNGMHQYRVQWGTYESGTTISVQAKDVEQALNKAKYVAGLKGYSGEAVQVLLKNTLVWDYLNGHVREKSSA